MTYFPVIEALEVRNYLLYPGSSDGSAPGLDLSFGSGPWLVLGVNGLGKSTLLLIIRHLLAGPFWATEAGPAGSLRSDIVAVDRRLFAARVADGARSATARLTVRFGARRFMIERRLNDLSAIACSVDGRPIAVAEDMEGAVRAALVQLVGVGSFPDVLRILRWLTFVLEQRDGLIWSPPAQSELFRALFLPPERASKWRELEGVIVSADSSSRNVSAALNKILQRQRRDMLLSTAEPEVRARLAALAGEQDRDTEREIALMDAHDRADDGRIDARDAARMREQESENRRRDYERLKFNALQQAFEGATESQQYLFLTLLSERVCPACGGDASDLTAELERRRVEGRCAICGTPKAGSAAVISAEEFSEERALRAYQNWSAAEALAEEARAALDDAEQHYAGINSELAALRVAIDRRNSEIRSLQRRLPRSDRDSAASQEEITFYRRRVLEFREERNAAEDQLEGLLAEARVAVEEVRLRIIDEFQLRATAFLFEGFRLVYAPDRRSVGQTGRVFEFPAFEVELTGGAIEGRAARRNAEQVSLSQREYLDLAFRMAVTNAIANSGAALIIDGPEGSVDDVFARKAGHLLAEYSYAGHGGNNQIVAACNLVNTPLIPSLLTSYPQGPEREQRVVNLLNVAAPTAAVEQEKEAYEKAYQRILRDMPDEAGR